MNETSTKEIITGTERRRASVVGLRTDVCSHDLAVQRVGERRGAERAATSVFRPSTW